MNDPFYNQLCEAGRRRKLTAAEEAELRAWLEAHPEARADWEAEQRLNAALGALPDVPVANNFTALVLRAVEREATSALRSRPGWSWRRLLPRAAFAVTGVLCVAAVAGLGFRHHERIVARRMAQSVAAVSEVSSLPDPSVLEDFEAIRQLNSAPRPDVELLALLQ